MIGQNVWLLKKILVILLIYWPMNYANLKHWVFILLFLLFSDCNFQQSEVAPLEQLEITIRDSTIRTVGNYNQR
jgi:hypothetical protein